MKRLGYIASATAFTVGLSFVSYTIYKDLTFKPEPPKPLNVYCIDGSKWKTVHVSYVQNTYDLFNGTKWIARVPANACALHATE